MNDSNKKNLPYINITLVILNVIFFLYIEMCGSSKDSELMIEKGAMYIPLILQEGQYYRLVTSIFMHFGIEHLVNNMLILYVLGDNLERALGKIKYLIFYLVCGVGANIVSMFFTMKEADTVVSAGASGAIFGVIGGLLYAVVINKGRLEDLSTRQLVMVIGFSLYFGFTSTGVDNTAHVAGLIIGFVMSAILYRKPKIKYHYFDYEM